MTDSEPCEACDAFDADRCSHAHATTIRDSHHALLAAKDARLRELEKARDELMTAPEPCIKGHNTTGFNGRKPKEYDGQCHDCGHYYVSDDHFDDVANQITDKNDRLGQWGIQYAEHSNCAHALLREQAARLRELEKARDELMTAPNEGGG